MKERQPQKDRDLRHDDALAAAADWHGRLLDEDSSPASYVEFHAWASSDPQHKQAYGAVSQLWAQMEEAQSDPRIMRLRREAMAATQRPHWHRFGAAAAVAVLALGALWLAVPALQTALDGNTRQIADAGGESGTFQTAIGERSNITLTDGSSVVLNTNSRIDVKFTAHQRNVTLLAGQAWFQVAKNAGRPFVVEAGDRRVTALGTAFDVRLGEQDSVQVTLAEGRVSVEAIQSTLARLTSRATQAAELVPGESFTVSDRAPATKRKADVAKIGSWRQGQVVFDNDALETAVAEINRYSPTQIEIADPSLAQLKVSGVFKAGHSESFIETVTGHYPIRIAERQQARIVLAAKNP